ncbi:dihydrofolate reductase family protein [Demequina lignilytica]|uniref:Dihydrofolate reductase family protein n=1 Tax=Demequina lignilytica TaxID=3051663 RepID=A0AB35MEB6_9MICO|nr:dihydrofolate reductase family protein [Demequina sp. SYSU T0a273]MDN4482112.1 dihydrofolate reductase family protein [Demequina sp. SYSU T0a273]
MAEGALTLSGGTPERIEPDDAEARLTALAAQRPSTVRLAMVVSADGRATGPDGGARSLATPAGSRVAAVLRAACDVVLVGGQAARRERYADIALPEALVASRARQGLRALPVVAVVTHGGILPPGLTPEHTWVLTHAGSPAVTRLGPDWAGRIIVTGPDDVSPRTAMSELAARGMTRVLCEGGPTLAGRLLQRGVVDEAWITASSVPGGAQGKPAPAPPQGFTPALELVGDGATITRWLRR